jgi:eukaryotic-like serine/threonine-protein kinase
VRIVYGQLISGRYQLEAVLGRGGMATVWRGVDQRLGRPVAVKLLDRADTADPAMLQRFDREVRTAGGLTHPNIVAVYDVGTDDRVPYLVMELINGTSVAALLASGPLPVDQAVDVARQTCDALAMTHAQGVVHRDIKPANILLTTTGTVKVCDFGIARLAHQQQTNLTAPHTAIGTSAYMAPEQASGAPVDARTDLYALGCVMYAMLTGHPPFTGDNPLAVLWQHQHQPALSVASLRPDTPAELDALITRLLAKDPSDRPATATEVRDRLTVYAESKSAAAQPTRALPVASRHRPCRSSTTARNQLPPPAVDSDSARPASPRSPSAPRFSPRLPSPCSSRPQARMLPQPIRPARHAVMPRPRPVPRRPTARQRIPTPARPLPAQLAPPQSKPSLTIPAPTRQLAWPRSSA